MAGWLLSRPKPDRRKETVELKRVVVTGLGILCPVGNSPDEAWQNAANGVSGAERIPQFEELGLKVTFGAPVKNFDPEEFMGKREMRRTDRVTQLGLFSSRQALVDSGLDMGNENPFNIGVLMEPHGGFNR
jgi:3-oxoacyl-[acyl-carrier-protein] synthase II